MGGIGSGRNSRGWCGAEVGDYERIDIRELRKAGYVWSVGVTVQWRSCLWLAFIDGAMDITDDRAVRWTRRVLCDETPCHLGGTRKWFLCPLCERRTVELHLARDGLACRRCLELKYASQREAPSDRAMRRQRKIRARLGMGPNLVIPITVKPKGMHLSTFEHLQARDTGSAAVSIAIAWRLIKRRRAAQLIDLGKSPKPSARQRELN